MFPGHFYPRCRSPSSPRPLQPRRSSDAVRRRARQFSPCARTGERDAAPGLPRARARAARAGIAPRERGGAYHAHGGGDGGRAFAFELALAPAQPVLLQGDGGVSRKGADARAASYYYSEPQLDVTGVLSDGNTTETVRGRAWLDHE